CNRMRNPGRAKATVLANWRTAGGGARLAEGGPYDVVLAADVLYDEEDVAPLLALAPALLLAGGEFWLADPGRDGAARFVEEARRLGWIDRATEIERDWPAGAGHARIAFHRF